MVHTNMLTVLASILLISTVESKENYQTCLKKVHKEYSRCQEKNTKRSKKKETPINCETAKELSEKLCQENHPITHTTYDDKKSRNTLTVEPLPSSSSSQRSSTVSDSESNMTPELIWTDKDEKLLDQHMMNSDGFIQDISSFKDCKDKIHNLNKKLGTGYDNSLMSSNLVRALNKLCKIHFQRSSTSFPTSSFQTPSVFGSDSSRATSSNGDSPRTPENGTLNSNSMPNPGLF